VNPAKVAEREHRSDLKIAREAVEKAQNEATRPQYGGHRHLATSKPQANTQT